MTNPFRETGDFTRKSKITLHDHFTQSIYVVRHSLYPLSALANTSSDLYCCYVKILCKGLYLTLCLSSYVCMYPHKIVFKKYQFIIFNRCLNICSCIAVVWALSIMDMVNLKKLYEGKLKNTTAVYQSQVNEKFSRSYVNELGTMYDLVRNTVLTTCNATLMSKHKTGG